MFLVADSATKLFWNVIKCTSRMDYPRIDVVCSGIFDSSSRTEQLTVSGKMVSLLGFSLFLILRVSFFSHCFCKQRDLLLLYSYFLFFITKTIIGTTRTKSTTWQKPIRCTDYSVQPLLIRLICILARRRYPTSINKNYPLPVGITRVSVASNSLATILRRCIVVLLLVATETTKAVGSADGAE